MAFTACPVPTFLSLSDSVAVESLLQDIPFFAAGLLGFAVATLMFVTRRMPWAGLLLVCSMSFGFIAGVLDLFRILVAQQKDDDPRLWPLFIAQEVTLALSTGTRFFFFVSYAAPKLLVYPLEGALSLGAVGVAALEIVWRLMTQSNPQQNVYLASAVLELAMGAALVAQLAHGCLVSPTPREHRRRDAVVVVGLLIGLGVSAGNIATLDFADSTLGRFLQAIQMYILALVVMMFVIDPPPPASESGTSPRDQLRRASSFVGLAIRASLSPFRGPPPNPDGEEQRRPSTAPRRATVDRFSQWISRRLSVTPPADPETDGKRLWTGRDVERGQLSAVGPMDDGALTPGVGGTPQTAGWKDPVLTTVAAPLTPGSEIRFASPTQDPEKAQYIARPDSQALAVPSRRASIASTTRSSVLPDADRRGRPRSAGAATPVFGLEGIIRNLNLRERPPSERMPSRDGSTGTGTGSGSDSTRPSAGLATLMREQAELDRSMANLLAFAPPPARTPEPEPAAEAMRESTAASSSYKSESGLSTLSSFPAPPEPRGRLVVDDVPFDLVRPRPPPPLTPQPVRGSEYTNASIIAGYAERAGSGTSGFDVTSFIGNLSTPRPSSDSVPSTPVSATIVDLRLSRVPSFARARIVEPSPLARGVVEEEDGEVTPTPTGIAPLRVRVPAPVAGPDSGSRTLRSPGSRDTLRGQGLPARVRMLPISGPIPRAQAPLSYDSPRAPPAPK